MERTQHRPLVTGVIAPAGPRLRRSPRGRRLRRALARRQPARRRAGPRATAFYVGVYTLWLKRTSTQNIVIGGAAGAVPVLVGWAAVTGLARLGADRAVRRHVLLDAAALLGAGDPLRRRLPGRRRADAPGRRADARRRRQMVGYTVALVVATLVLIPVADLGWIYAVAAVVARRGVPRRHDRPRPRPDAGPPACGCSRTASPTSRCCSPR